MNEYLTIKELSDLLNISRQAIYTKINTNWHGICDYVSTVDGKAVIKRDALGAVFDKPYQEKQDDLVSLVSTLQASIQDRDSQIRRLNDKISHLTAQVDSLLRQNENLSESLKLSAQTKAYQIVNKKDDKVSFWKRLFSKSDTNEKGL